MSRTRREYGWYKTNYQRTQEGLGCFYADDPRNAYEHGYDGVNPSYYYDSYPGKGWRENYQQTTRKYVKRAYAKGRRREKIELE